jgi:outer membrane biosynthesis protein TonB
MTATRILLIAFACVAAAACTSLQPATSRPAPPPIVTPPSPAPSPAPPPAPPSSQPLPRPSPPQAVPPASRNSTAPSRPQSDASGASGALLEQARNQRAAGNTAQATASIERALRLDPNNAEQAATLARKALSLAGSNSSVSARAQRLLQAAGTR